MQLSDEHSVTIQKRHGSIGAKKRHIRYNRKRCFAQGAQSSGDTTRFAAKQSRKFPGGRLNGRLPAGAEPAPGGAEF